jgi:hypothetical protein
MADVKLLKPERITDNPDGGGLSTGIEIPDGVVNNLFDDISRIDRVNGDVSLRKTFVQADTADTEVYSGLHLIVQARPQDPRVDALLFETGSWSDERDDARQYVERFLDPSVPTRMIPYDRQLEGQRLVLVFQRPEVSLPEIGDVFVLENQATEAQEFIRIADVDHEVQTFSDGSGDFQARVLTLTITQPLSQEFPGTQPNRFFNADGNASIVRRTSPSDAARYRGTVALAQNVDAGALTIKLDSVYGQLVPSATRESGISNAEPAGPTVRVESSAQLTIERSMSAETGVPIRFNGERAIQPGSAILTVKYELTTGTWQDDGNGEMVHVSGPTFDATVTIDYDTGVVTYIHPQNSALILTLKYHASVALSRAAYSFQTPIKLNTRGYVYLANLNPLPVPRTVTVSYRALGRWYDLTDDGTGQLVGEIGTGSGQVIYGTGGISVTLGALPDIGSSVIFSWGSGSELEIRTGDTNITPPRVELSLSHELEPASLSLAWLAGGVAKTATCNAAGIISGDAVGYVEPDTSTVVFRPTLIPDDNSTVTASYGDYATPYATENFTPTESGGAIAMTLADLPKPGTVTVSLTYFRDGNQSEPFTFLFKDDGAGNFTSQGFAAPAEIIADAEIDYGTGIITLPASITYSSARAVYEQLNDALPGRTLDADTGLYSAVSTPRRKIVGQEISAGTWHFNDSGVGLGGTVGVRYVDNASAVGSPYVEEFPMPGLKLDLTPGVINAIVPGGLLFAFGGRRYIDRQGTLYHTIDPATGAGTVGGTINYTSGQITLTDYASGSSPAFSVLALLTEVNPVPISVLHSRTPGAPLRPGSFFIQANRMSDGALISAIADNDGNLSTANLHGYIDVVTGVFAVAFGAWVLDSSLTADDKAEPWYNAGNVDGSGYIWRPREVIPGTVRFSCVVQTSLPLDPEIIGVNPVRLPLDGRVQIIRAGDTLVIHDTQAEALANPAVAGSTEALPRGGLASVVIYDSLGVAVDPALYTLDLVEGDIIWDDPLDLSAYTQPLTALHTIEDMALCTDAQITGEVTLAQPLANAYTADNSVCSSALILGDVQARVEHLFAQNTWTNVWSDDLIGDPPTGGGQYNDVTYPPVVTNESAITQRWRLTFTSSSAFTITAEELGGFGTGNTSTNVAPVNPATGQPYFTLLAAGFGTGWATGNVIRFNTVAAGGPVWIARTVKSGPASNVDDRMKIQTRWDKD